MYIYVYIRNQNTKTPKHFFQSPARRTIFGAGFTANHPGELELPAHRAETTLGKHFDIGSRHNTLS